MKNNFKYIKNILKVLIWPIILLIGQFFIKYFFVLYYNFSNKGTMDEKEFLKYINTNAYKTNLNNFINSKILFIVIIVAIIFIPLMYHFYKKYKNNNKFNKKGIILLILTGISISLIYNIILYNLNILLNFTNKYSVVNNNILIQLVTTGILGPIIEEIMFRGIIYNKLKEFNKPMKAIILCSLMFALFHGNIFDAIYGFGVSFILIYYYEKYKNLVAPILFHMSLNITIIVLYKIIIQNYLMLNLSLLLVGIIVLIIFRKNINKNV